jgi:hypothetical protein
MRSRASEAVSEFHEFFGDIVRDEPTRITGDELKLRMNLLKEEFNELMDELWVGDIESTYKEMADLLYVLYGLDCYMGRRLDDVFEAVHASNMTKLWECDACKGKGSVLRSTCFTEAGEAWGGMSFSCWECGGTGKRVKYRDDGKVLKSPQHSKADLSFLKS